MLFASPPAPPHSQARYRYLADVARWGLVESLPVREPWRPLYEMLPSFVSRPAKSLRPVLCLAACGAFGGTVEEALPVAVAFELIHNAFLVHDDIEDGSASRRGQRTMHQRVGIPLAVNAGDAMNALSMRLFRQ
ncbi:MAG TPA: polyprenyl synthetase family protein, partial [Acidimicrobiia bacterium]|nr:polyprenyl synthetase family protein [Acidimicrobiia bacterium]